MRRERATAMDGITATIADSSTIDFGSAAQLA
jgi:hypothetical protein